MTWMCVQQGPQALAHKGQVSASCRRYWNCCACIHLFYCLWQHGECFQESIRPAPDVARSIYGYETGVSRTSLLHLVYCMLIWLVARSARFIAYVSSVCYSVATGPKAETLFWKHPAQPEKAGHRRKEMGPWCLLFSTTFADVFDIFWSQHPAEGADSTHPQSSESYPPSLTQLSVFLPQTKEWDRHLQKEFHHTCLRHLP